jgi:hypothetical protein
MPYHLTECKQLFANVPFFEFFESMDAMSR